MSFGWRWADRTNHIHSPYFKWPERSCRAKISWCLVNEVIMNLTSVASLSVSDGVRDHFWPIISKSLESISKFWTRLVSSTHTVMSLFECFLCLFLRQAAEDDTIMWSAIQCSYDRIVVEFRGFPSNGRCLFRIIWQNIVQCVFDVRKSSIPELWTRWSL